MYRFVRKLSLLSPKERKELRRIFEFIYYDKLDPKHVRRLKGFANRYQIQYGVFRLTVRLNHAGVWLLKLEALRTLARNRGRC